MSSIENKKKIFFPNLDGFRFFCFFFVFMVHSFVSERAEINNNPIHIFLKKFLFAGGHLGVNMFFVLSGFLITYLLVKEKEFSGSISIKHFYVRRILRIWPLYFFCVFFGFVLFPYFKTLFGQVSTETANPLYYFIFASNFDLIKTGGADSSMLNILWSVSIEEQFYLFWPLVVLIVPPKRLWIVLVSVIILSNIYRALYYQNLGTEVHTFSAANDLAIGCLMACVALQKNKIKDSLLRLKVSGYVLAHLFFILLFIIFHQIDLGIFDFLKRVVFAMSFAIIIFLQCFSAIKIWALGKFKWISNLGEYTYGLYCLHMIAILIVTTLANKFLPNHSATLLFLVIFPLTLILSIALAKISFKYFESYFLKLKNKFSIITK